MYNIKIVKKGGVYRVYYVTRFLFWKEAVPVVSHAFNPTKYNCYGSSRPLETLEDARKLAKSYVDSFVNVTFVNEDGTI